MKHPDTPPLPALLRWADLCHSDFAALDPARTVALLPLAAIEQHGPHLPLSVDADLLEGVLAAVAPHLAAGWPVYVLPTQAVGYSSEHQRFAGTLTLEPETVLRLWLELGQSVARAGVRKLLLFNGHGGHNGLLEVAARELRGRCGLLVYGASWFNLPLLDAQGQDLLERLSPEERRFGIHAGQIETAMMLALRPHLVRMQQARHFHSSAQERARRWPILGNGRSAKLGWQMQDYHPEGAVGNAAAADAALGHELLQAAGRSLAELLRELCELPLATLCPDPAAPPQA